jgi:adenosylmethionine-8-amino-7-oxononanoate aminotransferase
VLGAIGVIETVSPVDMARVQKVVMEHGVWLRPFRNLIYTMPPYISAPDEIAQITAAMLAAARAS